jgi:membrane protease YdiL (CAAX protease family)
MGEKILYYLMPFFRVLLFVLFIILCFLPVLIIFSFDFIPFNEKSLITQLFYEFGVALAVIGALLMVFKTLPNYDFETVFITDNKIISAFLKGSLIGFVLLVLCALLAYFNGNVTFTVGKINVLLFIGYFIYYIFVAIFEELLFRSFSLRVFTERYPIAIAILVSSILFGLAHLGNYYFNWIAMVNITLAGALFSIFILQKRNIAWAIGLHFGWNFTQGTILGYQVSGNNSLGLLSAKPVGASYLSGGNFGIESSLFCTLIMVILIAYLLIRYKIEPVAENTIDTDIQDEIITE